VITYMMLSGQRPFWDECVLLLASITAARCPVSSDHCPPFHSSSGVTLCVNERLSELRGCLPFPCVLRDIAILMVLPYLVDRWCVLQQPETAANEDRGSKVQAQCAGAV
jgi:hypothetical protein